MKWVKRDSRDETRARGWSYTNKHEAERQLWLVELCSTRW